MSLATTAFTYRIATHTTRTTKEKFFGRVEILRRQLSGQAKHQTDAIAHRLIARDGCIDFVEGTFGGGSGSI